MDAAVEQLQMLLELKARHDELLERLDDLDRRVAGVLAACQSPRAAEPVTQGAAENVLRAT